jgi:hypothetical protein
MINTKHVSIRATICIFNNKLQKISFKKKFIWKNEKKLKRTHSPFVKQSRWLLFTYLHPYNHLKCYYS